jgi:hypothetical protein
MADHISAIVVLSAETGLNDTAFLVIKAPPHAAWPESLNRIDYEAPTTDALAENILKFLVFGAVNCCHI